MTGLETFATAEAAAAHVADEIVRLVAARPGAVLGLATGATMRPVYARLAAAARAGQVSFGQARTFNLDEYAGLPPSHPASFAAFMHAALFGPARFDPARTSLPDGMARDPAAEAARYEAAIVQAGGIDLQLLGIGRNGHIGFNEPGAAFGSRTRCVMLDRSTRDANRRSFPPGTDVPGHAVTMGIGTIMEARAVLLLATGRPKARAVAAAWAGPPGPHCPASALRRHPCATFVCDAEAASLLENTR